MTCGAPEVVAESCDCQLRVSIGNTCSGAIEWVGADFDSCWPRDASEVSCSSLAPGQQGAVVVVLEKTGDTTESFVLRVADGEHRVQVAAHVDEFRNTNCLLCAIGAAGGSGGRNWFAAALAAALVGSMRRRRKS
jgi:MYXO-CTERM domain-containing protein